MSSSSLCQWRAVNAAETNHASTGLARDAAAGCQPMYLGSGLLGTSGLTLHASCFQRYSFFSERVYLEKSMQQVHGHLCDRIFYHIKKYKSCLFGSRFHVPCPAAPADKCPRR